MRDSMILRTTLEERTVSTNLLDVLGFLKVNDKSVNGFIHLSGSHHVMGGFNITRLHLVIQLFKDFFDNISFGCFTDFNRACDAARE
ncbi:hypothetical protein Barb4_05453 [Bacteroidales bacterium Barb4]|nr:hypothetical protein Barb4_05453 [Bacteroidales bacterium Barb4]